MKKMYIMELSIVVAILNIIDGIFTSYGITNHFIEELNPIMKILTNFSPLLFLALKFILSITIVFVSYKIFKIGATYFKKWYYIGLFCVFLLYAGIFSMHIIWISQI